MDDDLPQAPKTTTAKDAQQPPQRWRVCLHESIDAIATDDWNRCAGSDNPLQSHALLVAMENSRSACVDTGWLPRHISLADSKGHIHGVMPFYIKSHSYGEYVFDHAWAQAFEHAGGRYYPKGQVAVPFTPVPGRRLMVSSPAPDEAVSALAAAAVEAGANMGLSSLHITFLSKSETDLLIPENEPLENNNDKNGWIRREGLQFHWHNRGYDDFADFLDRLTSRKRKSLRRERKAIADSGVRFQCLRGADISPRHWDAFYAFYLATIEKKWGGAHLTRAFFAEIGETMADSILLIMAERDGDIIAGAINFIGSDTLYGRNWGCVVDVPFLHFETCYYQAIDYAIENGLGTVEAGAQGPHKVQRGYEPVSTFSAHYLYNASFSDAVRRFCEDEARLIAHDASKLMEMTPYRKEDD